MTPNDARQTSRSLGWVAWTLAVGLLVLSTGMGIGAWLLYQSAAEFVARGVEVEGRVIDLVEVIDREDRSRTYKPEYTFTDADGNEWTDVASVSTNPPSYDVGDKIAIVYDPDQPRDSRVNSFGALWLGPIILGVFSVVFLGAGGLVLPVANATAKTPHRPEPADTLRDDPFDDDRSDDDETHDDGFSFDSADRDRFSIEATDHDAGDHSSYDSPYDDE